MLSRTGSLQLRHCGSSEIGIGDSRDGKDWPVGEVLLASVPGPHSTHYLLAIPDAILEGAVLTTFLDRVAPFGCPPPHSLIRAYSLPDSPFPSILLKEHDEAPEGVGDSYRRFLARARLHGREFPVWVDLPAHQPTLLSSRLLTRVERFLAEA